MLENLRWKLNKIEWRCFFSYDGGFDCIEGGRCGKPDILPNFFGFYKNFGGFYKPFLHPSKFTSFPQLPGHKFEILPLFKFWL